MTTYAEAMGHSHHRRIKALEETAVSIDGRLIAVEDAVKDLEFRHQQKIEELQGHINGLQVQVNDLQHRLEQAERGIPHSHE